MLRPIHVFALGLLVLPAALSAAACGDDPEAKKGAPNGNNNNGNGDGGTPPWGTPPGSVSLAGCDNGAAAAPDKSSGYLLITENRLAKLKEEVKANSPRFQKLKANTDKYLTNLDAEKAGPENAALMYLLTNDNKYLTSAWAWSQQVRGQDLQSDSYLGYGAMATSIALVLNWTAAGLTDAQKKELADWLDASTDELWNHNKGSGWATGDDFPSAGNNYRMGFIEGTVHAGYALRGIGDSRGQKWIDSAIDKLERKGGVFDYLATRQNGGDWLEGSNYGQRSKQRLYHALAAIASMDGKNYFNEKEYVANSIQFAEYQAQPGYKVAYPTGDLARSYGNEICPFDREYMQIATYWLCDSPARRLGQHFLTKVATTYEDADNSFDYGEAFYLDLLYSLDIDVLDVKTLPLSFRAAGTNWVNSRSSWDADATSFSLNGAPYLEQGHQHFDVGTFLLYKNGWLLVDPESLDSGGDYWRPEMNQGIYAGSAVQQRYSNVPVPGLTQYSDKGAALFAHVDESKAYRHHNEGVEADQLLVDEHTRDIVYLRPDTVFVFDRVAAPQSPGYYLNFHFASMPTATGGYYTAKNDKSGISFAKVLGGAITVKSDGGSRGASRIQEAAEGDTSRYLNVMQVASGAAPAIDPKPIGGINPADAVRGAVWNDTVVVFSNAKAGTPAALPFSYTVPGTGKLTHMLVNMTPNQAVKITATPDSGSTKVTVESGSGSSADADGVIVANP
jgi:hypothetical protein